jgi:hypothetical protein
MKAKKDPIVIISYSDLLKFFQKQELDMYVDDLNTLLASVKIRKNAEKHIDSLLGASLHINEAESVEYFAIAASAIAKTKKLYIGIKNPTTISSGSKEAISLKKYIEWGTQHHKFLLEKTDKDYPMRTYFMALGTEICLLAWIKKSTNEVFLNTIVNKKEALLSNTERRLVILTNKTLIHQFNLDFMRLSNTKVLPHDYKETLQLVLVRAIMLYESYGFAFNYPHYLTVIGIRKDDKPYYYQGDKHLKTLIRALMAMSL